MASTSSSTVSTPEDQDRRRGRKRLRFEQEWARKKRKLQKDRGEAHTSYKGERKAAKELENLTCKCQYNCGEKLNAPERRRIFEQFYKLGSHDAQNKYLYGLIRKKSVQRKTRGVTIRRSQTIAYHIRLRDGTHVQVCKKTFCDLHAIGKRRVERLCLKLSAGVLVASDERGKHSNRPHAISEELKRKVREHIKSFPCRKSHYSRTDNKKKRYLPENLSIARMHQMYVSKFEPGVRESGSQPQVKEWLYRKIFNEEFNLSFGYPRSDTCETCDQLRVAIEASKSEAEREELQGELAAHQEKASQGYQSLRNDAAVAKRESGCNLLTFDMMQTLPVPTLTHSSMFYLRQMWTYNFGIHDMAAGTATMCLWDETIASRGADEICSCLKEYIASLPPETKRLTCFSDSCFGQNKNFQMICFWNWLVCQGRFEQVDHKFLVRGHTYLPNDRDFAHIEKRKDSAQVYIPAHWETVIREACVSKPFNVAPMDSTKFLSFSDLLKQHTQRKKDANGKSVLISKAVWMNFGQAEEVAGGHQHMRKHPNEVWIRYSFNLDEPWSKLNLLKGRKKMQPSSSLSLPVKYPNGHPLNPNKIADLQRMVPFLPEEYRQFY